MSDTLWGERRPGDRAQTVNGDGSAIIYGLPDWLRLPDDKRFGPLAGQPVRRVATVRHCQRPKFITTQSGERALDGWENESAVWHLMAYMFDDDTTCPPSSRPILLPIAVVEGCEDGFVWIEISLDQVEQLLDQYDEQQNGSGGVIIYTDSDEDARQVLDELRELPVQEVHDA